MGFYNEYDFLKPMEASSRTAYLVSEDMIHYTIAINNSKILNLDEVFMSQYVGFRFDNYPFLKVPFKNFIDRIQEGGFMSYFEEKSTNWKDQFKFKKDEATENVALTIEKLSEGFQLFLVMLALAVVVFILEVVNVNLRRNIAKLRTLRERIRRKKQRRNNRRKLKKPTQLRVDFIH